MMRRTKLDHFEAWLILLQQVSHSGREISRPDEEAMEAEFHAAFASAQKDWALVVFSNRRTSAVARYFSYQLQSIGQLAARIEVLEAGHRQTVPAHHFSQKFWAQAHAHGVELIHHLRQHHFQFFDTGLPVPRLCQIMLKAECHEALTSLLQLWEVHKTGQEPARLMRQWFVALFQPEPGSPAPYRFWFYLLELFRQTRQEVTADPDVDPTTAIWWVWTRVNFNHLGAFAYLQEALQQSVTALSPEQQLDIYRRHHLWLCHYQPPAGLAYDPQWPALATLLQGWLAEHIQQITSGQEVPLLPAFTKIKLNLSVAHLACLLKLGYELELFSDPHLGRLIKFAARHFSTKRQSAISAQSFSKEYYSISQITAARVRNLLSRMIARLNQLYFPVWVAMYILYHGQ